MQRRAEYPGTPLDGLVLPHALPTCKLAGLVIEG